jgi:hypothetical protein
VDITYEPFACGPTVYVGNSVDGPAIAAELAPMRAETMHDTMLDDLLVMNYLPKKAGIKLQVETSDKEAPSPVACSAAGSVVDSHVETMTVR